ncbi:RND family efflux transporter MFP subunit [Rhodobacter aestuarii]|uniref:RND family efflux transporter, MFP subunit n=1 Tax=Rhodobacter aestuarii TaxID=453582 RepID=A0A1N7MU31_9RHOB|nr:MULTISPECIES: efflux RND transporter periplasmic adaptor subunit [Rhodobacter]PTV96530.1 RND family efflux transporter MFP subunit [Rhodobacter aestuarii]SIS89606.1 RND family efflux transporter, MFP subunit [Rhodobacter aestuarii]SOB91661.1 RND family efflux transporter MFP subunit [Rhodobacter sp. JA431]
MPCAYRSRFAALGVALWLAAAPPVLAEAPLAVQIVTAHTGPVFFHVELSGTITAAEAVPVGFRAEGRILTLTAEVGMRIAEGQILAQLDPTQAAAALRAAQAQDAAAEAMLVQAEQARARAAELAERGAATQAALDAATEAALSARSSRDQARAALAKAQQALEDCTLRAPADGIVTERDAEPGQIVGAAQTVLTIARDGAREAVFYVPDFSALDRFQGRTVTLRPVEGTGPEREAIVTEIAPLVAGESGTVRVKAQLIGAPGEKPPGLGTAVVSVVDLPYGSAMALPWSALVRQGAKPAVWTVDPKTRRAQLTPIRVLRYTDNQIEVAEGLSEGALVVTEGAHLLYPGRVVMQEGAQ